MNIYIGRNGVMMGQFKLSELLTAIAQDVVSHTDHAWHKGLRTWGTVAEVVPPLLPPIAHGAMPEAVSMGED